MRLKHLILQFLLGMSLILLSCQKPTQSVQNMYLNKSIISVTSLYFNPDSGFVVTSIPANDTSIWKENIAFRINFNKQLDTWDPKKLDQVVIYAVYRKQQNSGNQVVVGYSFGSGNSSLTKRAVYTYRDALGNSHSITYIDSGYIYDTINDRTSESFNYGVAAITDLKRNVDNIDFVGGFTNIAEYTSNSIPVKPPIQISINRGAVYTADTSVIVSGLFDTTGVEALYYYRYSEIMPVDTLTTWLDKIVKHKDSPASFPIKASDSLKISNRSDIQYIIGSADSTKKNMFPFGKLGKVDTVFKADFHNFFTSYSVDLQGLASFTLKDALVTGPGKKWVMLWPKPKQESIKLWSPLYDDIAIDTYEGSLLLDLNAPGIDYRINEFEKKLCLVSNSIPVIFRAFGNPTFSGQIYIWLATRNVTSDFYDQKFNVSSVPSLVPLYASNRIDTIYDCILETIPDTFNIDANGDALGILRNLDLEQNIRVSPLLQSKKNTMEPISRTNDDPIGLSRSVEPGSILGYNTNLNPYTPSKVYTYNGNTRKADMGIGWHTKNDPGNTTDTSVTKYSRVEYIASYDAVTYSNPIRNLPINVPSAKDGVKEFVLIAYTKGKYFNEPRVFISKFSSSYKYVWDRMPPHITWSIQYNPLANRIYAPLYYHNPAAPLTDRITNLSQLGNIFDVWLDPRPSTEDNEIVAGVRDVGFGRIRSAVLNFHFSGKYKASPITGERIYDDGMESQKFPMDQSLIEGQSLSLFNGVIPSKRSYSIFQAGFIGVDARGWDRGQWDMWIETEDDLGNKGVAPFGGKEINRAIGSYITRQIEIK